MESSTAAPSSSSFCFRDHQQQEDATESDTSSDISSLSGYRAEKSDLESMTGKADKESISRVKNKDITGTVQLHMFAPKLFNGLKFYFAGDFVSSYKEGLQNLVIAAGGTILEEELVEQTNNQAAPSRRIVVYNLDPPQGCKLGDEVSILW
ncbi:hypothetical protein GH714_026723 [Hevea brasiliensis]|uniref:BRCT domain-containing protein n=1 Tax=Hevea brasiliensis TaxID=3981 RepID=A0A6A6KXK1_HEVBR|nr:hypothetical protein GH714_026723 [Hevea brasiliensis]